MLDSKYHLVVSRSAFSYLVSPSLALATCTGWVQSYSPRVYLRPLGQLTMPSGSSFTFRSLRPSSPVPL